MAGALLRVLSRLRLISISNVRAASSPVMTRRTSPSIVRSIRFGDANMAVSIALRGRRTPMSAIPLVSISRRKFSSRTARPRRWSGSCRRRGYLAKTLAIGSNTDPYQPAEKRHRVMRGILEVLARTNHPVGIVTKSALVTRDSTCSLRWRARVSSRSRFP